MKKRIICLLLIGILLLTGCNKKENPIVTMEIENYGTIKIELYPNEAENTVANFVSLVENGFYNNNTFHRLDGNFVLQGGDPSATGSGGPDYTIKGEFSKNGYNNTLSHTKKIVSMARSQDLNSAGSQFFIMLSDDYADILDGSYAAFGKVTEGWDVIEKIMNDDNLKPDEQNMGMLEEPIKITKTTVDTKGETYKVKKIED